MAHRILVITASIVALSVAGCRGAGTESIQKIDGAIVTVGMDSTPIIADGVYSGKSGELEYVVDHMQLKVNGRKYGTLEQGDHVRIETGKVTINGQDRKPD